MSFLIGLFDLIVIFWISCCFGLIVWNSYLHIIIYMPGKLKHDWNSPPAGSVLGCLAFGAMFYWLFTFM